MDSDAYPSASEPGIGYWDGENLELDKRFFYRPEVVPLLLGYLGARPDTHILDVGCGAGFLARLLAANLHAATVIGLDGDERMIALARRSLVQAGLEDRVEFRRGSASDLPFDDASFDLATSHTLLCILGDPERALREKIRVVRAGGVVSAVVCFCHTDGLPHYHGRYPLPGNHRIDALQYRLWQVWRQTVRPRLLGLDVSVVTQDLAWSFRAAGLSDVQVNGHLRLVSPGDDRLPLDAAASYAVERQTRELARLVGWRDDHGDELAAHGFATEEFDDLLALKRARLDYLRDDPSRVREVMEVYTDPLLIVRGTKPPGSRRAGRRASSPPPSPRAPRSGRTPPRSGGRAGPPPA